MGHPISFKIGGIHLPHFRHHTKIEAVQPLVYSVTGERAELRKALSVNLERGLFFATIIHLVLLGCYYGVEFWKAQQEEAPMMRVRIMKYSDLGPPPSITNSMSAPIVGVAKGVRPSIGTPIPVPDAEINPEQTIATQTEMSAQVGPGVELGKNSGEQIEIANDVVIEDDDPGMNDFIPVEKPPQIVHSVQPAYPEIARRAGVEGVVWVKALVDKNGKPKKAVVIKENVSGIFNEVAVNAAMQYQFTPAIMNTGPVQVWVVLKFKFELVGKNLQ